MKREYYFMKSNFLGYLLFYVLPPLVWAGMILIATSLPGDSLPKIGPEIFGADKVVHFCVYSVLGALLLRMGSERWIYHRLLWWFLVCFTMGACFGFLDEWHQALVPGRTASAADWAADCLGLIMGMGVWAWKVRKKATQILAPAASVEK